MPRNIAVRRIRCCSKDFYVKNSSSPSGDSLFVPPAVVLPRTPDSLFSSFHFYCVRNKKRASLKRIREAVDDERGKRLHWTANLLPAVSFYARDLLAVQGQLESSSSFPIHRRAGQIIIIIQIGIYFDGALDGLRYQFIQPNEGGATWETFAY